MNNNTKKTVQDNLKTIHNITVLMKDYFKPFEQFVEDKKYSFNDAVKAKESIHKYLYKYGTFMLETTTNNIQNAISNIE